MNESLKQKVERAVGDEFVEWFNRATGSEFQFDRIGADPPNLVYRVGDKTMPVEVSLRARFHSMTASSSW
jgi:hypothetical protein